MRKVLTCNRFPLDKVASRTCLCVSEFFPQRKELEIVRIQVERRKEGRIKSKKDGIVESILFGFLRDHTRVNFEFLYHDRVIS